MFAPPKFILIIVLVFAAWYVMRWWNRYVPKPRTAARARPQQRAASGPAQRAVEDLVACRTCGTYLAPSAPSCGKPGCPQPR